MFQVAYLDDGNIPETSMRHGARLSRALRFFLGCVLLATALLFITGDAYADEGASGLEDIRIWHSKTLVPGEDYDVSSASKNTTVFINRPGSYTLRGNSTYVRVVVQSGGVDLNLHNVRIDPGAYAYGGSSTAGIIVEDKGGTVKLISSSGLESYIDGYLLAPAIQKDGTKTQLVFETENPDLPGLITAHRSPGSSSAAIGCTGRAIGAPKEFDTGNIVINSGRIVATGGYESAGIGGGARCGVSGITINGGSVESRGGNRAAGIGGGFSGHVENITINGGTVRAEGAGGGAGIGGGQVGASTYNADMRNLKIAGGDIVAIGGPYQGSGIGGGQGCSVDGLYVSGGTIVAKGGETAGVGIGAGRMADLRRCRISGGTISANGGSGGTGIGVHRGDSDIEISGGRIIAIVRGEESCGIGGGLNRFNHETCRISITGGTIEALGDSADIGRADGKDTTVTITGGSVDCNSITGGAKNQSGSPVFKTNVTLQGAGNGTQVTRLDIAEIKPSYGMKDLYTVGHGELFPWLPDGCMVTDARANPQDGGRFDVYHGEVKSAASGTLYLGVKLLLIANGGTEHGEAFAYNQSTSMLILKEPKGREGWSIEGYAVGTDDKGDWNLIADSTGAFIPNKTHGETTLTNADGQWVYPASELDGYWLAAYSVWKEPYYYVDYDFNMPQTASTVPAGIDTMPSERAEIDCAFPLRLCTFELPGYDFLGWNTRPDGSGVFYDDGEEVENLTTVAGTTVTLYAQWKPKPYTIKLHVGEGEEAQTQDVQAKFDQPVTLSFAGNLPDGKRIVGWNGLSLGSLYSNETQVVNLCGLDKESGDILNPEVNLYAVLVGTGKAYLTITNDGRIVQLADPHDMITLTGENGVSYKPFAADENGVYTTASDGSTPLPDGEYVVSIDGWDTRDRMIEIKDGFGMLSLEYFTVSVGATEQASAWIQTDGKTSVEKCMAGDTLRIAATTNPGYSFDSWLAGGVSPTNWDAGAADQIITLGGPVTLTACSAPNAYEIVFDANGGEGYMDSQAMSYGETRPLDVNRFMRVGYEFAGWTATPEWTGAVIGDGDEVSDLTTERDGKVTLYAQWTPLPYYVEFNSNGADYGPVMLEQEMFLDQSANLLRCSYTRENYHFTGWNTEADGSGQAFSDGESVINLSTEPDSLVTLYAQWEHDYYTVEYDANGGVGEMSAQEVLSKEGDCLLPCNFVREDYEFAGWNTEADGSGDIYQPGVALERDLAQPGETITLYAQWVEDSHPDNPTDPDDPVPSDSNDPKKPDSASEKLAATGDSDAGIIGVLALTSVCSLAVSLHGRCRGDRR